MTVDYLRGNTTANATGLFVICKHLARHPDGCAEEDLRRSLRLLRSDEDPISLLDKSLEVGKNIGLLERKANASALKVDREVGASLEKATDAWPVFRGELLHKINKHALDALSAKEKLPDLVGGLAIFVQSDPLSPLTEAWGEGSEEYFKKKVGSNYVENPTQWSPFKRWALSLGLARSAGSTKPGVIIPDASTAIADQLHALPASGTASEWLSALRDRLPVLGSATFTAELPEGRVWSDVPPAVVLGLLKLERSDHLKLEPTDDASDVISIGLGADSRQIGRIEVMSRHA